MAIQPRYAQAILKGTKLVEFRKRPLAPDIRTVMIYESSPTQSIVGKFTVASTVVATPRHLWRQFGGVGGISRADLLAYYAGADRGVALVIGSIERFELPFALAALDPRPAIPQSFTYVDPDVLAQAEKLHRSRVHQPA